MTRCIFTASPICSDELEADYTGYCRGLPDVENAYDAIEEMIANAAVLNRPNFILTRRKPLPIQAFYIIGSTRHAATMWPKISMLYMKSRPMMPWRHSPKINNDHARLLRTTRSVDQLPRKRYQTNPQLMTLRPWHSLIARWIPRWTPLDFGNAAIRSGPVWSRGWHSPFGEVYPLPISIRPCDKCTVQRYDWRCGAYLKHISEAHYIDVLYQRQKQRCYKNINFIGVYNYTAAKTKRLKWSTAPTLAYRPRSLLTT